ncbi:MAG: 2-oxoacid:acceptor oxidoreductase family protein [Clostridiales bacterium]|jgi:2-oxoglutarate ferredoxin oxidoreductase subunit gamma|nr:2-oxoacid:acceptor oxidoreductase family protein [Clostridiales bacterium]
MKKTWQVIFSGVGGQGLMLAGKLLGAAATGYEGKNAVMTSAYGVETRGTFAKSDVTVSDEEIDYPEVLQADVVIALAPVAYKKYADTLTEGVILLYDDAIEPMPSKARQISFPITKIAKEAGNSSMVNIVALGVLVKLTGIVAEQSVENAIRQEFLKQEKLAELNLKALHGGLEAAASFTL